MQVNTSVTAISFTTTSISPNTPIEDNSFEDILQAVDTKDNRKPPFPLLQHLSEIIALATTQGKLTTAEHDEYMSLLDDIQKKLESFQDRKHECHHHIQDMQLLSMTTETTTISGNKNASGPLIPLDQNPAAFLIQTNFVAFETESLADFKAWIDTMIQDGKLSPKASEALNKFLELREKFVAMITDLQEVFATAQKSTMTETEAASRFLSGLVQSSKATTDTMAADTVESDTIATVDTDSNTGDTETNDTIVVEAPTENEESVDDETA
jgi:hypothetical protein